MPVYNAEKYIRLSIDSILNQSFTDLECIIVDDGSTDSTREIIRSYSDKRIIIIENRHNFIDSLNVGLQTARGKYIARMDADDIMHPDRIKIQHAIMEAEPSITICGTWMKHIGDNVPPNSIANTLNGLIEMPLVFFLRGNYLFHPTVMVRKEFLIKHKLQYECYSYAEDYKLWTEIAKRGGQIYIDSQPLLYYRISEAQISRQKKEEQQETAAQIMDEVIDSLITRNNKSTPELFAALKELRKLQQKGLIKRIDIASFFQSLFIKNKNTLIID